MKGAMSHMTDRTALIARVAADLGDAGGAEWSAEALTPPLRRALDAVSRRRPRRLASVVPTVAGVRTLPIAALEGLLAVVAVEYPYSAALRAPAPPVGWRLSEEGTLELALADAPRGDGTDDAVVRYLAAHTIEGLDGAQVTTLDPPLLDAVVLGAAGWAAETMAVALANAVTVGDASARYSAWARERLAAFDRALAEVPEPDGAGDPRVVWLGEV